MKLNYKPLLPVEEHAIYIIGAGGIVKDAHLPAYKKAGFKVAGIYNRTLSRAEALASAYEIPLVSDNLVEFIEASKADPKAVYDLALMPNQFIEALELLPDGAGVLIQKPMGDDIAQSKAILEVCRRKGLKAAINCQLRFAPFVSAARNLIGEGAIGELHDMEVKVCLHTPWEYFPNVINHPRLEIQQHSIHYVDLVRSFLGDPATVMAKTLRNPGKPMSSTRTTMIFDYGDAMHVTINTNHDHNYGLRNQESYIKWEGTHGAIKAKMGLLMNYPDGVPDKFEYCSTKEGGDLTWHEVALEGTWFPDGFVGAMASLLRYVEGSETTLPTSVEDVIKSMTVVEAAYESSDKGGIKPEYNL